MAGGTLHGVKLPMVMGLFQRAPALQHEIAILDLDLDIADVDSGEVRFEDKSFRRLVEIDGRIPTADFPAKAPGTMNDFIKQSFHFARKMHWKRNQVILFLCHRLLSPRRNPPPGVG